MTANTDPFYATAPTVTDNLQEALVMMNDIEALASQTQSRLNDLNCRLRWLRAKLDEVDNGLDSL